LLTWFLTQTGFRRFQFVFRGKRFGIVIALLKVASGSSELDARRHQMRAAVRQQSDPAPRNHLEKVLEKELDLLQQRVLETAKGEFFFYLTGSATEFLLLMATEEDLGAQRLKLAIETHVVYPLADLFATDQIHVGDTVRIERDQNQDRLTFNREVKDLVTSLRRLEPEVMAGSVPKNIGQFVEALAG